MKAIKERLKKHYCFLERAYSDHLAYGGKSDEQEAVKIYLLRDILTLINELEGENERLVKELEDMPIPFMGCMLENQLLSDISKEKNGEIKALKNRIAELENENDTKLKQFVERLKEKMNEGEYMGEKYKLSVFRDIDIIETLKELKEKWRNVSI